ncbi:hypothetical protein L6164_037864 [Bauhinia variegata]|uniref:Uncharacterized protein n=1 Tax=Bauhinia variegata TaxID=167791 RepID=A0ACB9KLF9_BAUVA|nr:hypothetical protein L6164_037864 [Bauhinia variegata]
MVQRLFIVLAREPKRTRLLPTVLDLRPGILPLSNRNQPPLYCARTKSVLFGKTELDKAKKIECSTEANKDHRIFNEWKQATLLIKVREEPEGKNRFLTGRKKEPFVPGNEVRFGEREAARLRGMDSSIDESDLGSLSRRRTSLEVEREGNRQNRNSTFGWPRPIARGTRTKTSPQKGLRFSKKTKSRQLSGSYRFAMAIASSNGEVLDLAD